MADSPVARRVEDEISTVVADLGYLVEDVTVTPAGKRRVVRIAVDRDLGDVPPLGAAPEGEAQTSIPPLDLDAVADATRAISDVLEDSASLGSAPYTLEVTSPGVSRPLTLPRHFRRNVGRLVTLVLSEGGSATGRVLAAGSDAVRIRVEDPADGSQTQTHPLDRITRGEVQVEFGRVADDQQED
ncbi:ribosome maturation factor RimP [Mobilicoccus caccae]|uniref:Ribosome maturation factor RimP n=1 Tax=Mobilicoccus caccae TaxID=1859295 RepID=A0ABQ6IQC6_9MICO|nr:ribosome maturation factor RimP [Mobilicoccus caccae]GMA40115.1 ribosome maturation factor RimP [Mobilicoccus caccae]